jgi:hypothetical protein
MANESSLNPGPGLEALTQELAAQIAELKRRAQRARNNRAHARCVGALIPLYGLLLRALVESRGTVAARDAVAQELQALQQAMQTDPAAAEPA